MALPATYDVRWSYDFDDHLMNIGWFATRGWTWIPLEICRTAYHPPLYYVLAAALTGLGVSLQGLGMFSALAGCLRFALLLLGLELLLPGRRVARLAALALAAVLPASVQLDGMVTNEGLSCLLCTVALLLVVPLFSRGGGARWRWALTLGAVLGLALLVKVSALMIVAAIGAAALVEAARDRSAGRLRRFAPLIAGLAVTAAVSGFYFVHNQRAYGKLVLSGFDGPEHARTARFDAIPYLRRRPLWFYAAVGLQPVAQFWTPLIASTFVDYYNFAYAPYPDPSAPQELANFRPLRPDVLAVSRPSMAAGALVAATTLFAWCVALAGVWRRREWGRLALLFVPLFALAGQLHFSVKYPVDSEGMIKATYLQFAAAPLFALFGLAVAWLWSRPPWGRVLACVELAAVAAIGVYSWYCRLI